MDKFLLFIGIILVVAVSGIQTDLSIIKSENRIMERLEQIEGKIE